MEYQEVINLLDNTPNQSTKFRTKNWVEKKDESRGTYYKNNQIRFKTSMLMLSLCDYSYAYIFVKGTITVRNIAEAGPAANNVNRKIIFKSCAPFTSSISRINNTQVDDAQYIDIVTQICNLIQYSANSVSTRQL